MLHLIPRLLPASLHRTAYRLAHALRRLWWRLRRPRIYGCRVLALDDLGRVLLVRHSYGSTKWMAPGGGLRRGEDSLHAAVRELGEEVGCRLEGAWLLAVVEEPLSGATNVVHLVAGRLAGTPKPDGREIVEAACFAPDALPASMPELLRRELPGWLDKIQSSPARGGGSPQG
ncbi:NUDIX domain-containing protein [Novosphingobium sp. JCM 18896]|uniref:NUDIX domain-containing protein n=1 Tax=Novosphingobium sp. JCM 18896 TaxID=2989731 RepID=UPI002221D3A5|nr:NUDIX domain-containing protein [Novosphingobium sp. JCM 18896]MCW1430319.1 NUDIX domain-containing protein [Novosphingobium sp. JCM 18896]